MGKKSTVRMLLVETDEPYLVQATLDYQVNLT